TKLSKSALLNALLHVFLNALLPKMSKKSLLHFLFVILDSIAENKRRGDPSLKKAKGGLLVTKSTKISKSALLNSLLHVFLNALLPKMSKKSLLHFLFVILDSIAENKRRGDASLKKSKGGTLGNKKYQTLKKCTFKCTFTCIFKCTFTKNVKKVTFALFVCNP